MKKLLSQLKLDSILLLTICIGLSLFFYIKSYDLSFNKDEQAAYYTKIDKFIAETKDIDKLKRVSKTLLKSDESHANYIEKQFINAGNIALIFTILPALIYLRVYRLNKQFLTSSSSGTDNP